MIVVKETVFKEDGSVEYETEKQWSLKFRFLNAFKKISGVSSHVISDLSKSNESEFVIDGVKRKISITPQLYTGDLD